MLHNIYILKFIYLKIYKFRVLKLQTGICFQIETKALLKKSLLVGFKMDLLDLELTSDISQRPHPPIEI